MWGLQTAYMQHKNAKKAKAFKYNLPYTINNTPHIVKDKVNTHSFQGFSLKVKQYLIHKYDTNCIYHGTATYVSRMPRLRLTTATQ